MKPFVIISDAVAYCAYAAAGRQMSFLFRNIHGTVEYCQARTNTFNMVEAVRGTEAHL